MHLLQPVASSLKVSKEKMRCSESNRLKRSFSSLREYLASLRNGWVTFAERGRFWCRMDTIFGFFILLMGHSERSKCGCVSFLILVVVGSFDLFTCSAGRIFLVCPTFGLPHRMHAQLHDHGTLSTCVRLVDKCMHAIITYHLWSEFLLM